MMKSLLPLHEMPMDYYSIIEHKSQVMPGVVFEIRRMSLGRRLEMSRQIRELSTRMEFSQAGDGFTDQVDATVLGLEIDRVYLRWGLVAISGLVVDGLPATVDILLEAGPEDLCREIINTVRVECGLNEEERKN